MSPSRLSVARAPSPRSVQSRRRDVSPAEAGGVAAFVRRFHRGQRGQAIYMVVVFFFLLVGPK